MEFDLTDSHDCQSDYVQIASKFRVKWPPRLFEANQFLRKHLIVAQLKCKLLTDLCILTSMTSEVVQMTSEAVRGHFIHGRKSSTE